ELNELPNNKEKYNKILSYFDLSLDTLDWEELNKEAYKFQKLESIFIDYRKNIASYSFNIPKNKGRISYNYIFAYPNNNRYSMENLATIKILSTWRTRCYSLSGNEGTGIYLSEKILTCNDI
ncbi:hypothetical protein, partial [Helicobacter sp. MIT 14-3879]|uniref:hypothetical protein n=1 Tax=Helicobacter sp. MIT 14-3879 TaxID=2040649 RepID=UPI000E1ED357